MTDTTFADSYGPWALIAGASMGIGAALSHEAAAPGPQRGAARPRRGAARGDRRRGRRPSTGSRSAPSPPTSPRPTSAPSSTRPPSDLEIGLFVYNAAVGPNARFIDGDLDLHLLSVAVNCRTPVDALPPLRQPDGGPGPRRHRRHQLHGRAPGCGELQHLQRRQGASSGSSPRASGPSSATGASTPPACWSGATSSPNYNAFQETLDPELCNRTDTDDPLDRARSRLMRPSTPEEVATAALDGLGSGPVAYTSPDDAFVGRPLLLAAPRRGHPRVAPAPGDLVARPRSDRQVSRRLKVVQWTTGKTGSAAVRGMVDHPVHRPRRLLRLLRRQGRARRR